MAERDQDYALGHTSRELERLIEQARFFGQLTRNVLVEAGLSPGMRVLDVGCGPGDVSFLAASLVGPDGEVVGVDQSPAAIDVARGRAAGVPNVRFVAAAEIDIDMLEERIRSEGVAAGAIVVAPPFVGAWARKASLADLKVGTTGCRGVDSRRVSGFRTSRLARGRPTTTPASKLNAARSRPCRPHSLEITTGVCVQSRVVRKKGKQRQIRTLIESRHTIAAIPS
jgi:predicted RNA methylase